MDQTFLEERFAFSNMIQINLIGKFVSSCYVNEFPRIQKSHIQTLHLYKVVFDAHKSQVKQ